VTESQRAAQFRKKPVIVDATQWFKNGDHPEDYTADQEGLENGEHRVFTGAERKAAGWEGGVVRYYRHPEVSGESLCEQCGKPHHVHGWIDTLEQGHRVCPGDWIITGVQGERYPCKPDIFAKTYEDAGAARSEAPAGWREALEFYAQGHHFNLSDDTAWDTVSGEPQNFYCDEAGTATVEDGSVARAALAGVPLRDDERSDEIETLKAERDRLHALLNSPETRDFLVGVRNEVAHQVERWGTVHDRAKEPADWFWLVGYLAGKALAAHKDGNTEKALHHCISTAAVLANWHTHIALGVGRLSPGSSDLQAFLRETFGSNFVEYQADAAMSPPDSSGQEA
jgi:hypothetical protein